MILIGLGSNLGDREKNILAAIEMLGQHEDITIDKVSSLYETEPVGLKEQPSFYNAAAAVTTFLTPLQLLDRCLDIERRLGRVRTIKWGPRNIDIDLLAYNDVVINLPRLTLPHPQMPNRRFVLIPLLEIAGSDKIYYGKSSAELLSICPDQSEVRLLKTIG